MALTSIRAETADAHRWREAASCRSTDPDLFFPVGATGPALDHIAAAKAVCTTCPVQAACLEFAIESNQDSGVWGGASEEERRHIRRQRLRQRRATAAAAAAATASA
jgi:WhiB family redox-sensing transcriptional regulator